MSKTNFISTLSLLLYGWCYAFKALLSAKLQNLHTAFQIFFDRNFFQYLFCNLLKNSVL